MHQSYIICGKPGAGKGTLCRYLEKRTGGKIFKVSSITQKILQEFDIPESRKNFSRMNILLRKLFGDDIYVHGMYVFLEGHEREGIIFDGVRKMNLIRAIRETMDATIIYVEASPELRYKRVRERGEKHGEKNLTYEAFLEEDNLSTESELIAIKNIADRVIENNRTEGEFFEKIDSLLLR